MEIILNQFAATAVKLKNNDFEIIADRPKEKGGNGLGLMGGQYLLIGIGGCFCSNIFGAAETRNIKIKGLQVKVSASFSEDKPTKFETITLNVSYKSVSDEKTAKKIFKIAEKACVAINSVKSGIKVTLEN